MHITRREFLGFAGVLGLSAGASARIAPRGGKNGSFQIAVLGDLHILDERSMDLVRKAAGQIAAAKDVRLAVVAGDLATDAKRSELNLAKEALKNLPVPCLAVPGNHDVEPRAARPFGHFENVFGPLHWVRDQDGWTLIGLNSCEGASSNVTIPAGELDWLRKRVNTINNNRPIALILHHPLNPNTKAYRVKNADAVLDIFSGKNLKLAAAGHYHGNQSEERNGVLFTTTACCSSTRGNFDGTAAKGYRLFTFDGDSVSSEFVEVAP